MPLSPLGKKTLPNYNLCLLTNQVGIPPRIHICIPPLDLPNSLDSLLQILCPTTCHVEDEIGHLPYFLPFSSCLCCIIPVPNSYKYFMLEQMWYRSPELQALTSTETSWWIRVLASPQKSTTTNLVKDSLPNKRSQHTTELWVPTYMEAICLTVVHTI